MSLSIVSNAWSAVKRLATRLHTVPGAPNKCNTASPHEDTFLEGGTVYDNVPQGPKYDTCDNNVGASALSNTTSIDGICVYKVNEPTWANAPGMQVYSTPMQWGTAGTQVPGSIPDGFGKLREHHDTSESSSTEEPVAGSRSAERYCRKIRRKCFSQRRKGSVFNMDHHGPRQKRSHCRSRSRWEDAIQYDGKYDFRHYLLQFEMQAEDNDWDDMEKGRKLSRALTDDAVVVLSSIDSRMRRDYKTLCKKLTALHTTPGGDHMRRCELYDAARQANEQIHEFGSRIQLLATYAFPNDELPEITLADIFMRGLNDDEMQSHVRLQLPDTLQEAVEHACNYNAYRLPQSRHVACGGPEMQRGSMAVSDTSPAALVAELLRLNAVIICLLVQSNVGDSSVPLRQNRRSRRAALARKPYGA